MTEMQSFTESLYGDSYLEHHGIKGMKWGVRRFQNEDGSLTAAGRKRYSVGEVKRAYKEYKTSRSEKKSAKKEVNKLQKGLMKDPYTRASIASMAAFAHLNPSDYAQAAEALSRGRMATSASFKKNYDSKSVDVYFSNLKEPTLRLQMRDGQNFSINFLNGADEVSYNKFMDYMKKYG